MPVTETESQQPQTSEVQKSTVNENTPIYFAPQQQYYPNIVIQQPMQQNGQQLNEKVYPKNVNTYPIIQQPLLYGSIQQDVQPPQTSCKTTSSSKKERCCLLCCTFLFVFFFVMCIVYFSLFMSVVVKPGSNSDFLIQECRRLDNTRKPPTEYESKSWNNIKKVKLSISQTNFRSKHYIEIYKGKYERVQLESTVYGLSKDSLKDLTLSYDVYDKTLYIKYYPERNYKSNFGCATAHIELYVPEDIDLEDLDITVPSSSSILGSGFRAERVALKTNDYITSNAYFNMTNTRIKNFEIQTTGNVRLQQHNCYDAQSYGSLKVTSKTIYANGVSSCQSIEADAKEQTFSKVRMLDSSSTVKTSTMTGEKATKEFIDFEITDNSFALFDAKSNGNTKLTLVSRQSLETLFDVTSETSYSSLTGLSGTFNYFRNTYNKKQGRLNCQNCNKEINLKSNNGVAILEQKY